MKWDLQHWLIVVGYGLGFGGTVAAHWQSLPTSPVEIGSLVLLTVASVASFFKRPPVSLSQAVGQGASDASDDLYATASETPSEPETPIAKRSHKKSS